MKLYAVDLFVIIKLQKHLVIVKCDKYVTK